MSEINEREKVILQLMNNGGNFKVYQIAAALSISVPSANNYLNVLAVKGLILKIKTRNGYLYKLKGGNYNGENGNLAQE